MGVADDPVPDAPISGLSHVQFRVADLGVSTRWYRAALGLVPMAEDHDLGYVALRHPGSGVVVVLTSVPGPPGGPGPTGPGSVDHLAFAVPDRDALVEWAAHLMAVGIDHAGVVLEDGRPSLQLRDPDGTAIELVTGRRPAPV
jgi:catechol-2,3-dioxygenase